MRLPLIAINTCAAILSLLWLWGHSASRTSDWELWFALTYLFVALANLAFFFRHGRRSSRETDLDEL